MAEGVDKPIDMNGSYRHKVDAKGRMSLPAAFRKVLSEDLVVTLSPDDECLYAFEPQAFEDWIVSLFESKFGGYDPTSKAHVGLRRKLKSRANNVSVDNAGRIGIPAELRSTRTSSHWATRATSRSGTQSASMSRMTTST